MTIFRSRLRPGAEDDYRRLAEEMSQRAHRAPGFVDERFYLGADGERVTLVRFADRDSHRAWAEDPVHRVAQRRGRDDLYEGYEVSVCEEVSTRHVVCGVAASREPIHETPAQEASTQEASTQEAFTQEELTGPQ